MLLYNIFFRKFFAYIIGTKGSRKKQLENETKTEITIPRTSNDKNIVITGPTASNVASARSRIERISAELRQKHSITHFVSYPLISDEIKKNFAEFKVRLLNAILIVAFIYFNYFRT